MIISPAGKCLFAAISLLLGAPLFAQEKLERGKDRIDTPAVGTGLCVHNLFQSNMVVQRDRPIPIRGWAAPGEEVTVSFGGQSRSVTTAPSGMSREASTAWPATGCWFSSGRACSRR